MTLTQKIAVTVTAIAASLVVAAGVTAGIRHHKGKPVCPECITKLFSTGNGDQKPADGDQSSTEGVQPQQANGTDDTSSKNQNDTEKSEEF